MLDTILLQSSQTLRSTLERCSLWQGLLNRRRCFRKSRSPRGSGNYLFDPSIPNINRKLQNRASLSKVYSLIITSRSLFQTIGLKISEGSHCLEWGASAADCSGKLVQMICTRKSPLNHCLSPVFGLLFLLCTLETSL